MSRAARRRFGDPGHPAKFEHIALVYCLSFSALWLFSEWRAPVAEVVQDWRKGGVDSAIFTYIGELLLRGGRPYQAYFDHKPPFVHLINALGLFISGGHMWGIWLICLTALWGAIVAAFAAMRPVLGPAGTALGLFTFTCLGVKSPLFNVPEFYALPLQWLVLLCFVRMPKAAPSECLILGLAIGLLGGTAGFFKPTLIGASFAASFVLVVSLARKRQWRNSLHFIFGAAAGAITVAAAVFGWLVAQGAVGDFVEQVLRYNVAYSTGSLVERGRALISGIYGLVGVAGLVLPTAGAFIALRRLTSGREGKQPIELLAFALLWIGVEAALASTSAMAFPNYFMPLLGPFALLAGLVGAEFATEGRWPAVDHESRSSKHIIAACCVGTAAVPLALALITLRDEPPGLERLRTADPVARYVRGHTMAGDPLFIWGHAGDLYRLAGRRPASRFVYVLPLLTRGYAGPAIIGELVRELEATRPPLIIDASSDDKYPGYAPTLDRWNPDWPDDNGGPWSATPALKSFYGYMQSNYVRVGRFEASGWVVYRRRDGPPLEPF